MPLDPLIKPLLLRHKLAQTAPMKRPPSEVAEEGADQPACAHAGKGCEPKRYHWVEGDDAHDGILEGGIGG